MCSCVDAHGAHGREARHSLVRFRPHARCYTGTSRNAARWSSRGFPVHKTRLDPKDLPPVEAATLRRILTYVRPYWRRALLVTACMTTAAALSLSLPWFMRRVVDEAIPQGNLRLLWLYCAAMIAGPAL